MLTQHLLSMGIPMQSYPVTLDRFETLLLEQVQKLDGA
jgi:hypothetical protein